MTEIFHLVSMQNPWVLQFLKNTFRIHIENLETGVSKTCSFIKGKREMHFAFFNETLKFKSWSNISWETRNSLSCERTWQVVLGEQLWVSRNVVCFMQQQIKKREKDRERESIRSVDLTPRINCRLFSPSAYKTESLRDLMVNLSYKNFIYERSRADRFKFNSPEVCPCLIISYEMSFAYILSHTLPCWQLRSMYKSL